MIFIALGILSLVSQVQNLESPIRMTLAGDNGIDESITEENFLFGPGASRLSISGDFRSTASVKMRGLRQISGPALFRPMFGMLSNVYNVYSVYIYIYIII